MPSKHSNKWWGNYLQTHPSTVKLFPAFCPINIFKFGLWQRRVKVQRIVWLLSFWYGNKTEFHLNLTLLIHWYIKCWVMEGEEGVHWIVTIMNNLIILLWSEDSEWHDQHVTGDWVMQVHAVSNNNNICSRPCQVLNYHQSTPNHSLPFVQTF